MNLGGGLPMVYRKVACKSRVEWTKAALDNIIIPAGVHFPVPSPWQRADLPSKVGMEFPRITPNVEAG
jgi:hypothetical protein